MTQRYNIHKTGAEEDKEGAPSPPYISFLTFNNFITWLETEGIPLRFDRSFWQKKFSGSVGAQLMAGLRFLGLLKENVPQPELETITKAKGDERKALLAKVFRQVYSVVDFDALPRATPNMVTEWFRNYNLEGDTLRKAESFFINGCKSVDIPLSNALRKKARNKPPRSAVGVSKEKKHGKEKTGARVLSKEVTKPTSFDETQREQVSKVTLASGGEVILAINVDLFQLSKEDRDFVLNLVDIMKGYSDKTQK